MASITTILFDLDGTLIDSFPGIESAVLDSLERELPGVPHHFERSLVGPPIREIFTRSLHHPIPEVIARLEAAYRDLYDQAGCLKSIPYPGVVKTLEELARLGIQAFVVTNKPRLPTSRILDALHLAPFFVEALSPDSVQPRFTSKTQATAHLVEKYGLDRETTLFVGDSVDDALAAQACNLDFVAANYGYGQAHMGASQAIAAFTDLLNVIRPPQGAGHSC